jgi:RNA polymerase sigma-B factor
MMSTESITSLGAAASARADHGTLLAAAQNRDPAALRLLVEQHRPLVTRIASRMHGRRGSEELEDLIQVGMIGLLEAISRFDPERGRFSAFAATTISGTIKRHFRDRGWKLRIGRGLHDAAQAVIRATAELEKELGRAPSDDEIAAACSLEPGAVREAREVLRSAHPASLQAPVGEDGALGDSIGGDDPEIHRAELRGTISKVSSQLDRGDRELVALRFGLDRTQREIADQIGVSQMQVSRRLRRVLERMAEADPFSPAEETDPGPLSPA